MKKQGICFRTVYFPVLLLLACSFLTCSYVSDYVERNMTKRASFGIEVHYNSTTKVLSISWDEGCSDYAGTEIYVTDEPDNEYAGYRLICSGYDTPHPYFTPIDSIAGLKSGVKSFRIDCSNSNLRGRRYFFRVGLIHWDESDEDDRKDKYAGGSSWEIEPNRQTNYYSHSDISEISGYQMVELL